MHNLISIALSTWNSWASAFISVYSSDLPLFLSSDFVLSTLHQSYDDGWLPPAEHHFTLQTTGWNPGLYLIRTGIGSVTETRQMIVR